MCESCKAFSKSCNTFGIDAAHLCWVVSSLDLKWTKLKNPIKTNCAKVALKRLAFNNNINKYKITN